ncbi:MAG: 4Fe-4S binding protein [Bacillota bacterium]|nr:4Fe-4S binding protein [Bacillota bacterium]
MSVAVDGFPSREELRRSPGYPSEERLDRGACAVIECVQEIPCNPCETVCPYGAIKVGQPITNLPRLDAELCKGCGLCLAVCPGQAIFLVDKAFAPGEALVGFPYEYVPLPAAGERVPATNRAGEVVAEGRVIRVVNSSRNDRTPVVFLAVPLEVADEVRSMERRGQKPRPGQGE